MCSDVIKNYSVKLYSVNSLEADVLSGDVKACLDKLKGMELNNEPILGSFCRKKCVVTELQKKSGVIFFEFCFDNEKIVHNNGMPQICISKKSIRCRYYYESKIASVELGTEDEMKASINIINALDDYIALSLSSGMNFIYKSSRPYEYNFDDTKLMLFLRFMDKKMKLKRETDSKEDIISLESIIDDDAYLSDMYGKISKGKNRYVIFSGTGANGNVEKFHLYSQGIITTTASIEEKVVLHIEKLLSIMNDSQAIEFLEPMDDIIDECMNKICKSMHIEARQRRKMLVKHELINFAKECGFCIEYIDIVDMNILFNIIIYVALNSECIDVEGSSTEFEDYSALEDFLYSYMKCDNILNDTKFNCIMKNVKMLMKDNRHNMLKTINDVALSKKKK